MIISKIKELIKGVTYFLGEKDVFIVIFFIASVIISFNLGRISEKEDLARVRLEQSLIPQKRLADIQKEENLSLKDTPQKEGSSQNIWGSKSGTKFYYAWCSGASRIKEENRVYYSSQEDALKAGRTLASSCK